MISLIEFITTSAFITIGLVYLVRKFIDKYFENSLIKYKNNISKELESFKHKLNYKTEKLRFEFSQISNEHKIRYTKLYEDFGEIIKSTYTDIILLENELKKLTSRNQGKDWKNPYNNFEIKSLIEEFLKKFEVNRLYFSEELCEKIDYLIQSMNDINIKMYKAKGAESLNNDLTDGGLVLPIGQILKPKDTWFSLEEDVNNKIKQIRRDLEREFSKLLGVR